MCCVTFIFSRHCQGLSKVLNYWIITFSYLGYVYFLINVLRNRICSKHIKFSRHRNFSNEKWAIHKLMWLTYLTSQLLNNKKENFEAGFCTRNFKLPINLPLSRNFLWTSKRAETSRKRSTHGIFTSQEMGEE